jgi:aromatic-L-amino-acid decarboxylase
MLIADRGDVMDAASTLGLGRLREQALAHGVELLDEAWRSFDAPRPDQPAISAATRELTAGPLPEDGVGAGPALDDVARLLDESLAQSRPRFFGYVGSSGLEVAVLADALAAAHDVNLASAAGAADLVERQTIRWVAEFVGFPASAGEFTSGGMISNLTALTAARERALPGSRIGGAGLGGVVYASVEAHSSVERAVEVLGLGRTALRPVPVDARRRMDPAALAAMIAADRDAGRVPVAVVATGGTTLTGAVDPLRAIGEICRGQAIWMHVDGAYGLPAAATSTAGPMFDGLDLADSACLDAHKWLFVPKACGVLLVRDRAELEAAFTHAPAYMPADSDVRHPVEWTLEYSRPFRALKLWLAFRAHGAGAFRAAIAHNLTLAALLADLVRDSADLELVCEPSLSIVCLRRLPAHGVPDVHTAALARALQRDGRVYVTAAVVDGATSLRPCIVNFRTTEDDVRALVDVVGEVGRALERG